MYSIDQRLRRKRWVIPGDVRRGSGEETALGEADGVRSFWMNWGRGVLYR